MKYQITLANGAKIIADTVQYLKKGIAYRNGTLEVYMHEDMYLPGSIIRVPRKKY